MLVRPVNGLNHDSIVQPDGKIVVLADHDWKDVNSASPEDWTVLRRYNWNGSRDTTFGKVPFIPADYVPAYYDGPIGPVWCRGSRAPT